MLFEKIEKNLQNILTNKPKIILGFSGGPDSMFLFHFLKKLFQEGKIELIAAHFDHGWRLESAKDAQFCAKICERHKIQVFIGHAKDLSLKLKFNGSKEEIGRKLRRKFFENLLKEQNANFIALAQHLQDQQETFFWRIIRGCSLSGLTGMKQSASPYIRPLLNISKKEILEYLHTNNIEYLTDHTNESDAFLRNRIRKYLLPAAQKCDERFDQKFQSTLKHLQEEDAFLQKLTEKEFERIFSKDPKTTFFVGQLNTFKQLDIVLQKRLIILWFIAEKINFALSENYLNEVLRFLSSQRGGKHKLNQLWELVKNKNQFWISQS
jgi:tRNA(Ile)-lysidine synthase